MEKDSSRAELLLFFFFQISFWNCRRPFLPFSFSSSLWHSFLLFFLQVDLIGLYTWWLDRGPYADRPFPFFPPNRVVTSYLKFPA